MTKLTNDLNTLTQIPTNKLEDLVRLSLYCIDESFLETLLTGEDTCEYDIGIGKIIIGVCEDGIKYKFIPSQTLVEASVNTLKTRQNSFESRVEKSLVASIENLYKELL